MSDISALTASAVTASSTNKKSSGSWYEAMADAWGEALDRQADRIVAISDELNSAGIDTPSKAHELTAESLRMGFVSNASHTSLTSVASALETMARKQ